MKANEHRGGCGLKGQRSGRDSPLVWALINLFSRWELFVQDILVAKISGLQCSSMQCLIPTEEPELLEQWCKASRARKQKQPALLRVGLRTTTVVSTISRKQPRFKKGSSACVQIGKELLAVALFPDRSYTRGRSAGIGICHKECGKSLSLAGWGKD